MRIALDIDSTLHPYWDQFAAAARRRFGVTLAYEEQVTWSVEGLTREQLVAVVDDTHSEPTILAAVPYPGAVETVARWHAAGHFIQVTSHRRDRAREATERWLRAVGIPFDELHCSFDKVTRCAAAGIELLVDDSPVNLERALELGMAAATILHPWNESFCRRAGVLWARDWPRLAALLDPLLRASRLPPGGR